MDVMGTERFLFYFVSICAASVIKGVAGFGDALISTPLLSLALPNSVITPGLAPMSLLLNAGIVWKNRRHFSARVVLPIAAYVMMGIIHGTLIIGLGVEMLTRKPGTGRGVNAYVRAAVSFCSGVMAGLFGINMLFLAYMERVAVNREEFRANACFVFFLENSSRLCLLVAGGMFGRESLLLFLVAMPASLIGMKLGGLLDRRLSDGVSRRLIVWVFILGGVSTTLYALGQLI